MMMVLGSVTLFAQESNTLKATSGEIGTDVDNFLHTVYWKDVNPTGVFAFTRLGRQTPNGHLELGAAFKPGPLYLGLYYDGTVVGQQNALSKQGSFTINDEDINYSEIRKTNPNATYGVLVGVGETGIKFTYKDQLAITDVGTPATGSYNEVWTGHAIPAIEFGGKFGPLSKIGLTVDINYDRTVSVVNGGTSVAFSTMTNGPTAAVSGFNVTTMSGLLEAEGNYIEPEIYLKMGLGAITLENDLALRIYGVPSTKMDGKGEIQLGVASVLTNYDPATSANSSRFAVWDNRFYIKDTVTPSYNISGESGKLDYSVTAALPIEIGFIAHAINAKSEGPMDAELKDIYKGADFKVGVEPGLTAGVRFKPADLLAVQAGIGVDFFSWDLTAKGTTEVDAPTSGNAASLYTGLSGAGYAASGKSSTVETNFTYPTLSFAAGFTFSFKDKAALDFLFIKSTNPTIPGTIYKAVGDGLGIDETSVVLSIKL
jgi:hypothetical protein